MGIFDIDMISGLNKIETAIALIQAFTPPDQPYYLGDSGGRDSSVALDLTVRSKVPYDAHYCVSPIDPPEVHQFLKEYHPDTQWDYHARGFWKMVVKNDLPLRQQRWCCRVIKEAGGVGRSVIVGNRRDEG